MWHAACECDLARELSFDRAAIGLILTAHWLLLHARQPCTQQATSPPQPSPALPVPSVLFSLPVLNLKYLHLIAQGKEPKPDVNYDLDDNVEDDHRLQRGSIQMIKQSLFLIVDLCE